MTICGAPARRALRRLRASGDEGLSLVEVIVSLGVLGGIALAAASGLVLSTKTSATNRDRVVAASLAGDRLEQLRSAGAAAALSAGAPTEPLVEVPINGKKFLVKTASENVPDPVVGNPCLGAAAGTNSYVRTTVTVTWPGMAGAAPVRTDTRLTPRAGVGLVTSGRVRVVDRNGAGVNGVPVSLTPASAPTSVVNGSTGTNGYGCAVFANLPKDSYTVTVAKAGYVATTGDTTYSEVLSADPAEPAPLLTVPYDVAAGVAARFVQPATEPGFPAYAQPVDPPGLVFNNPGLQPLGTKLVAASSSDTLFPFVNGYQLYLGLCQDADPSTYNGTPNQPRLTVPVTPGVLSAAAPNPYQVNGGRLLASITQPKSNGSSTEEAPFVTVRATNNSGKCASPQSLVLGTTDVAGRIAALLPYGSWTISVVGRCAPGGGWPVVQLRPAAPTASGTLFVPRTTC